MEGSQASICETFSPNFARLPILNREAYEIMCKRDPSMKEHLAPELLEYYVTALLWARLLHLRAQYSSTKLTRVEHEYRSHFLERVLNVPEPIFNMLEMIGTVTSVYRLGSKLLLSDHWLPVFAVDGRGGYHGGRIDSDNHNLFEEVPSLGVSGDCIMRLMSDAAEPDFPFLPFNTRATRNLAGYFEASAAETTDSVKEFLKSISVTDVAFKEVVPGTRLNIDLVDYVSRAIDMSEAFRIKNFLLRYTSTEGSKTQLVRTHPDPAAASCRQPELNLAWTQLDVLPKCDFACDADAVEASYSAGFQLFKEAVKGSHDNWCCVRRALPSGTWYVPNSWIFNRNARRKLPAIDNRYRSRHQLDATLEYLDKYYRRITNDESNDEVS